ncbi:tRNA threonylcarbamoyladenosine biosynthesis protein TsaE [Dyadobacter sp. BE34]|uniref:tRNA threonylcarbamoyladenosine biosynthesis protein TsaE n=1 Tax=Dyadobacter fermentans TaxID=94254 RepID=A0ABU1QSB9_9BACT|nr:MULTISPECIES: tRNA (adenosine(37)-N6)-threonylcarbamoyltransferase complex ATPase subunit type 1 TsaE [Dyadobacter]MDR6803963.1 tRNA threonylcarbamoyladenosine biosynthesis protein TsaE [Dyadobacter fermentans]MDR7041703.1 tRNA threonylcarbamoyladenosine biosynthesis protein TsaE [Dyadobacter sp. BE242]MDR7196106.1 tRNA threonylcarbamoyladenosine biosynthesis protein TsaE [Dyadobacter sp. BE34]MDR7213349.1 tRNA threonylcarbamoyladenosine biosynthesis protein TsaE [Dyadobacter sp. BE31]MDR72
MIGQPTVIRFKELSELGNVSEALLRLGAETPVWLFEGQMGAGKTTLIKALCSHLGVTTHVQSPTFSLVNEYDAGGRTIYHFDFYRIKDETEALDMGVEEYFDSGDLCFVEWPGKVENLWPLKYMQLHLEADETGMRILEVTKV